MKPICEYNHRYSLQRVILLLEDLSTYIINLMIEIATFLYIKKSCGGLFYIEKGGTYDKKTARLILLKVKQKIQFNLWQREKGG